MPGATGAPAPSPIDEGMPGVAGQLVSVLSAPRPTANGTYQVTVALHPESLGTVQATVTAGQDRVAVHLVATTSDGANAIRMALPQLHEALAASGQRASVSVSVSGGGPGGPGADGEQAIGQGAGWQSTGQGGGSPQGGAAGDGAWTGGRAPARPSEGVTGPGSSTAGTEGRAPSLRPLIGGTRRLVDVRV